MKKNLPNYLTISRGVLTLLIIILFFLNINNKYSIILILFVLASATDFFDGYLARRWGTISEFGKMFDPLFDKVLTMSLYFFLFSLPGMPKLVFILLFLRELIVDGLKSFLLYKGTVTPAIFSAKLKTFFQILMIIFALLALVYPGMNLFMTMTNYLGIMAVGLAYWSGAIYARKFFRIFKA